MIASEKLSEELHELSGWEDTKSWYVNKYGDTITAEVGSYEWTEFPEYQEHKLYPAYELGYLLRKLNGYIGKFEFVPQANSNWLLFTHENFKEEYYQGKTPEDATALLAIELFKRGILKK